MSDHKGFTSDKADHKSDLKSEHAGEHKADHASGHKSDLAGARVGDQTSAHTGDHKAGHKAGHRAGHGKPYGFGENAIGRNPRMGEMVRSKKTGERGHIIAEVGEPKSHQQQYSVDWGTEERWEQERQNPQAAPTPPIEPGKESWHLADELLFEEPEPNEGHATTKGPDVKDL
jgi:hypothetical protein